MRKRDTYIKRGLLGVIEIDNRHSHLLENAEALKWLQRKDDTRVTFLKYFASGQKVLYFIKFTCFH